MDKLRWNPDMISRHRAEIMGFAAIWIVLFHSAIPAPDNMALRIIWYGAVSFGGGLGVNIFVFLSGFGLMFSHSRTSCCADWSSARAYLLRRFKRILIPYFTAAAVYFSIRCIGSGTGLRGFVEDITLLSFVSRGDRTYWYIFAILVLYCVYPLYMRLAQKFGQGRICAAAVALVCLAIYFGAFLKQCADLRLQRYLFMPVSIGCVIGLAGIFHLFPWMNRFFSMCGKYSLGIYLIHIPLYRLAAAAGGEKWNPYVVCLCVGVFSVLGAMGLEWLTQRIQMRNA